MSSRVRESQKLTKRDSPDSTKHGRPLHEDEENSNRRSSGSEKSDAESPFGQDFAAIGVAEFLELDPRPTFVVTADLGLEAGFEPTYSNEALRSNHHLVKSIAQHSSTNSPPSSPKVSSSLFRSWIKDSVRRGNPEASYPLTFSFCGLVWISFTVRERWIVISGSDTSHGTRGISGSLPLRSESPNTLQRAQEDQKEKRVPGPRNAPPSQIQTDNHPASFVTPGTADWTLAQPSGDLSQHVIFARSIDWAGTPLGDMSTWSKEFRQIANLVMSNPHPCALFWGDELTVIYNKAYAEGVAGRKHPGLMGTGFRGPFAELWATVGPTFTECVRTGRSVAMNEQMLPIERSVAFGMNA
jgi:hypothetical protein